MWLTDFWLNLLLTQFLNILQQNLNVSVYFSPYVSVFLLIVAVIGAGILLTANCIGVLCCQGYVNLKKKHSSSSRCPPSQRWLCLWRNGSLSLSVFLSCILIRKAHRTDGRTDGPRVIQVPPSLTSLRQRTKCNAGMIHISSLLGCHPHFKIEG